MRISLFTKICFLLLVCCYAHPDFYAQELADDSRLRQIYANTHDNFESTFRKLQMYCNKDPKKINQLRRFSQKENYRLGMAYAFNSLGIYERNSAHYQLAINHHKKSIDLADSIPEMKITALNKLGVVYRRMDAVQTALDFHQQALSISDTLVPKTNFVKKSIAISLTSIGNVYLTLKQYDLAATEFEKSLKIEIEMDSKKGMAINFHNLGKTYEHRGNLYKAKQYFMKSLSLNEEINSDLGKIICKNSIAQIHLKQGNHQEALDVLRSIMQKAELFGDDYYLTMVYINLGWAYRELNKHTLAEKYLQKGLYIAQQKRLMSSIADAYEQLSELQKSQKNYALAMHFLEAQLKAKDQYLNEKNYQYISDLLIKYDAQKKKNQIELLQKENEIVHIRLSKNNNILFFSILTILLLLLLFLILQERFKLRNQKEIIETEQQLLRTQINPHFIFNSLLSIKLYIQGNNKQDALLFLDQFSKLIRHILSSSMEKYIPLEEELEILQLYTNIENTRLDNDIEYSTDIDPRLKTRIIKIPALTLQPFIENAIWHGLSPKKEGDKKIRISVHPEGKNHILIAIEDNGIGRSKSKKQEAELPHKKQRSLGIYLTKKRLQQFSDSLKNHYDLKIIDLRQNQKPLGTRVELLLPIA
ncbi:MAG: tetratricopeptide repeat protein [Flavobacteriaceae bacterium]|nr:tetratricopeptide repeat protein [Flavobacteriaceae bacterium]